MDPVTSARQWVADIEETQGHKVTYPMIGDPEFKVAEALRHAAAESGTTSERPYGGQQRHGVQLAQTKGSS